MSVCQGNCESVGGVDGFKGCDWWACYSSRDLDGPWMGQRSEHVVGGSLERLRMQDLAELSSWRYEMFDGNV